VTTLESSKPLPAPGRCGPSSPIDHLDGALPRTRHKQLSDSNHNSNRHDDSLIMQDELTAVGDGNDDVPPHIVAGPTDGLPHVADDRGRSERLCFALAVWGSGVRVPSTPPRMNALVRSLLWSPGRSPFQGWTCPRARTVPDRRSIMLWLRVQASSMRLSRAEAMA
jgi:hypothetical protein